jgi:hypothetical protein
MPIVFSVLKIWTQGFIYTRQAPTTELHPEPCAQFFSGLSWPSFWGTSHITSDFVMCICGHRESIIVWHWHHFGDYIFQYLISEKTLGQIHCAKYHHKSTDWSSLIWWKENGSIDETSNWSFHKLVM